MASLVRHDKNNEPQNLKSGSVKGRKVEIVPGFITKYVYR